MKNYIIPVLLLLFITVLSGYSAAQTKVYQKVDVFPAPEGGISAIAQNMVYPEEAKKNKIEGKVMISAVISSTGKAEKVKVIKGIGHGCDEAAVDAVKKTKFKPGILNENPVATEITIPVKFKLK